MVPSRLATLVLTPDIFGAGRAYRCSVRLNQLPELSRNSASTP